MLPNPGHEELPLVEGVDGGVDGGADEGVDEGLGEELTDAGASSPPEEDPSPFPKSVCE